MKARLIKVLCCGLLLLSVTSLSAFSLAQVFDADWWVGGTLVVPTNGNVNVNFGIPELFSNGPDNFTFKHVEGSGMGYGLFVTHEWYNSTTILPSYRLEAQAWSFDPGFKLSGDYSRDTGIPALDLPSDQSFALSTNDVSLSVLFDLFDYGNFTPYVGAGIALLHSRISGYSISNNSEGNAPDITIEPGMASNTSAQYELGVNYRFSSRWAGSFSYEDYPEVLIKSGEVSDSSQKYPGFTSKMSMGFLNVRLAYRF